MVTQISKEFAIELAKNSAQKVGLNFSNFSATWSKIELGSSRISDEPSRGGGSSFEDLYSIMLGHIPYRFSADTNGTTGGHSSRFDIETFGTTKAVGTTSEVLFFVGFLTIQSAGTASIMSFFMERSSLDSKPYRVDINLQSKAANDHLFLNGVTGVLAGDPTIGKLTGMFDGYVVKGLQ